MIRLFLCEAMRQNRSIVSLCEDFGVSRFVQKELIRTIFTKKGCHQVATLPQINPLYASDRRTDCKNESK